MDVSLFTQAEEGLARRQWHGDLVLQVGEVQLRRVGDVGPIHQIAAFLQNEIANRLRPG